MLYKLERVKRSDKRLRNRPVANNGDLKLYFNKLGVWKRVHNFCVRVQPDQ